MAINTHRQLNISGSNTRQQDHHVHNPKNTKKYTAEVKEGNIMPARKKREMSETTLIFSGVT